MSHTAGTVPHPNAALERHWLDTAVVKATRGGYRVRLGNAEEPIWLFVTKAKAVLGATGLLATSALRAVANHLRAGGALAPAGEIPLPTTCPVCGGPIVFCPALTDEQRLGWRCLTQSAQDAATGTGHTWRELGAGHFREHTLRTAYTRAQEHEVKHEARTQPPGRPQGPRGPGGPPHPGAR